MTYIYCGIVYFIFVASKSFQQSNVHKRNYILMVPGSYSMAYCEVFMVAAIVAAQSPFLMAFSIGTGGWMGSMLATYLHNRFIPHG